MEVENKLEINRSFLGIFSHGKKDDKKHDYCKNSIDKMFVFRDGNDIQSLRNDISPKTRKR
jgi:hypothetical protein